MMNTNLQAGFSRIVCLPDDRVAHIAGNDAKTDISVDGLRDELAVTCIALQQGGKTYLVYTCDTVMINLASHATICSGKELKTKLSADFPYYARTHIEQNADVHCAYFIAAGGDSIPNRKMGLCPNAKDPNAFGTQLGEYVLSCLKNMTEAQSSDVTLYGEVYTAKRMKEGTEDEVRLAHAREVSAL